ncbi:MAG: PQQ-binding-like beta-propeller repeat protein [Myxococcota bacterium]|nr:PQQ-binding-like beta-propeller repeat protein [Myxococcota bacterium]
MAGLERIGSGVGGSTGAGVAVALAFALALPASAQELLLYSTENNRLRRLDVDSFDAPPLLQDVLIESASDSEQGGGDGPGRDVNGIVCALPDGSGRFVAGEDTGQPERIPGWGIFGADGIQQAKLAAHSFAGQAEPFGCAFAPDGRLFTTEIGNQAFGEQNGQLILWFPPFEGFPGEGEVNGRFCKIATDLGTATGVAVDDEGRVLVAASRAGTVFRFSGDFPTGPDAAGGCGRTDGVGDPLVDAGRIERESFIMDSRVATPTGIARAPTGGWYASSVLFGRIEEFDANGAWVRTIAAPPPGEDITMLPVSTGHPQSLAVGPDGTIYYADLDLRGSLLIPSTGANGSLRRVRFDAAGAPQPPETLVDGLRFPDGVALLPGDLEPSEWRTYGGSPERLFFNPDESIVTRDNVGELVTRWEFPADAIITASPIVAVVDVPGEGRVQVVYVPSWDERLYAVRMRDGSELWRFEADPQPGASFPAAASAHVERVGERDLVLVGIGEVMYALDAATGAEQWRFYAGTGCADENGVPPGLCAFDGERNEIESSGVVADGKVFFGMDVNDNVSGTGGFFAVDVETGFLAWYFDLQSGQTCTPLPGDQVTHFDGYHTLEELGIDIPDFSTTRPGCDFPRQPTGCGNVWSSPAWDAERGLLYVASSNCDTDDDPDTPQPTLGGFVMPPYDEAIFALDTDGVPAWRWRAREFDLADLAYGAVPQLFTIERDGRAIDVVGIGNKDASYTVLDRDGVNEESGLRWDAPNPLALPYWRTKVLRGGAVGGIIGTPSVDTEARRIFFATAPGFDPLDPQRPTVHVLDLDSGDVLWQNVGAVGLDGDSSFSPNGGVPGVHFTGSVISPSLRAFDAATGEILYNGFIGQQVLFSAVASAPTVIDGTLLVGTGIGTRTGDPDDISDFTSRIPHTLVALCVPGTDGCSACGNGRDDDRDGFADFPDDPGCDAFGEDDEQTPELACDNGLDDDGDELVDAADPGCPFPHAVLEDPVCDNGSDDDGDGATDFDDPDCSRVWPYLEMGCGLGVELVVVVPLLAAWRRRAARR